MPPWNEIKADVGPHLKRLPEELLPAIGKFLIIARDSCQSDDGLDDKALAETTLLLKCLTVVCRHFDNIQIVANHQYIECALNISMNIIIAVSDSLTTIVNILKKKMLKFKQIVKFSSFFSYSRISENPQQLR